MGKNHFLSLLTALVSTFLLTACQATGDNSNTNVNQIVNAASTPASRAKDNSDELALLVPMAIEPEEVSWREDNSDGANRKLTAVLLFSPANAEKVVESALKHGSVQESTIEVPRWFPAELVSQSELSEGGVVNVELYPAADFLQAPFTEGRLSRVKGTDHFVLELSAR